MRKFSWELEQVDAKKLLAKKQVESAAIPVRRSKLRLGITLPLALLGILCGAGLALSIGQSGLENLCLRFIWPSEGLVVYSKYYNGNALIEDPRKKVFKAAQLGSDGTLCLTDLPASGEGKYSIYLSAPASFTVKKTFKIEEKKLTALGYTERIPIPVSPNPEQNK